MELSQDALETIGNYVRSNLGLWIREVAPAAFSDRDLELRERAIRVEESLAHQRELMQQGFDHMEKRFEQVDKRFEQVDKRLNDMNQHMNRSFTVITVMLAIIGIAATISNFIG